MAMIATSIQAGRVVMGQKAMIKYSATDSMAEYATSLLSNWMRKDIRLNGGTVHKIKKPGARQLDKDSTIKQLRLMRKKLLDEKEKNLVDLEISRRIGQLTGSQDAI